MIWKRREWISVYQEGLFQMFMVESRLTFSALVDRIAADPSQPRPVEFLVDRELSFRVYSRLKPFHEWDPGTDPGGLHDPELGTPAARDVCQAYSAVRQGVRRWEEVQDGYRILLDTPSVLVGYRVEVYRSEGTTQWYTAVIVGYDENSGEVTVTDDTVLEEHTEHPKLTQIRLIGDVVDAIMRGETLQRRSSRHQTAQSPPSPPPPARFQHLLRQQQDGSSSSRNRRGSRSSAASTPTTSTAAASATSTASDASPAAVNNSSLPAAAPSSSSPSSSLASPAPTATPAPPAPPQQEESSAGQAAPNDDS
ncbi:hypothetical protein FOCC_FOCC006522, partial [Frankliniella occidentalis]